MIINVGIMYTSVDYQGNTLLQEKVEDMAHHKLGIKEDGAFHSPAYKSGFWDGITDFYNKANQSFHTGLLPQFLEGIRELQEIEPSITYDLEDQRPEPVLPVDAMDEEIVLGNGDEEPITLRPYQYAGAKKAIDEGVCILNLATNAGKTEVASGIMQQILPYLKRKQRIAFLCNSKEIFHQGAERIQKRLKLRPNQIGKIGDGKVDFKNKEVVMVMVPTLHSKLKDPKKGIKFTHKDRVIKFIAEEVAPKFNRTQNTRQLLRNYIKNCNLTTKVWLDVEEHLNYIAYDQSFTDKKAQLQLNKYIVELDKIIEKKNKKKFQAYKEMQEFLESVVVAIQDEAHEINGSTVFETISKFTNAQYRVALTGTVDKKNKMLWQRMQCVYGDSLLKVSNDFLINQGVSSKPLIRMVPIKEPRNLELINNYLEAYKACIVENDFRNQTIAKLVKWYIDSKPGGVLISVNHIEHGERVQALLKDMGYKSDFTHGGLTTEDRAEYLRRFSAGESRILLASSILDQGVDVKSIGMLCMSGGNKSLRQNLQRIGRGLRLNGIDGNTVLVFDFLDYTNKFMKSHAEERMRIYKEENFDVSVLGE